MVQMVDWEDYALLFICILLGAFYLIMLWAFFS